MCTTCYTLYLYIYILFHLETEGLHIYTHSSQALHDIQHSLYQAEFLFTVSTTFNGSMKYCILWMK